MKTKIFLVLSVVCGLVASVQGAQAYSERVKTACKADYKSFCSAYPIESRDMRRCIEANGNALSRRCVNAMVDDGDIPSRYRK